MEALAAKPIVDERKLVLQPLINYINSRITNGHNTAINFICTHNSRRSHLAQIWAQTAAAYYNISSVHCYSGGTEATALYPTVAQTLITQGFNISTIVESDNPLYAIRFSDIDMPIIAFSKKHNDALNPSKDYGAIMTCAHADDNCPIVYGADARIPVRYIDPKISDNTPQEKATYLERSEQIGAEMMYVFRAVNLHNQCNTQGNETPPTKLLL